MPAVPAQDGSSTSHAIAFACRYWRRDRATLSPQILLLLGAVCCDLATPWAAGYLLDVVSRPDRDAAAATRAVLILVALYVCQYGFRSAAQWLANRWAASGMQAIGQDFMNRVLGFGAAWHADTPSGATVRAVTRAMDGFNTASNAIFLLLGPSLVVLAGMIASISLKWPAAGVFVAVVAIAFLAFNFVLTSRWIQPVSDDTNARDAEVSSTIADVLGGHAIVRSFAAEAREETHFAHVLGGWRTTALRAWDRYGYLSLIQNAMLVILQAGLLGILVSFWAQGKASPGDVAFGVTSFLLIAGYLRSLPETLRLVRRSLDELAPAAAIAATPVQVRDRPGAQDMPSKVSTTARQIVFENVTFGYPGASEPLFRDLDLAIRAGEHVALIGATGAGKSTLASLITRNYDVQAGRILLAGLDIASVTQTSLRRSVAVVPQEPILFHRTVFENIAYGRPGAGARDVAKAAELACAHDFIERLPDGYQTLVGERGCKLSGGERQRIAIARAFLADRPFVIFDEATSSLDMETEDLVIRAAATLTKNRTTLTIAHRPSSLRNADRIITLRDGKIAETGTPQQIDAAITA